VGVADPLNQAGPVLAVLSAEEGRVLSINEAFSRVFGYSPEQVLGALPMEFGLWPDLSIGTAIWGELQAQGSVRGLEILARCADGRLQWCVLDCDCLILDGRTLIVGRIIGAQRQRLQACETPPTEAPGDSYQSLYWHAAEGLYRSLPSAGLVDVNPAMAAIFGFESTEQMLAEIGQDVSPLYASAADARLVREELDRFGVLRANRLAMCRRDGSPIWISENARTVFDPQGRALFYEGSIIDVSAQHEAQQALHESELLYRALVQNCRDGVFLIQRGRLLFVNEALADMLGYAAAELVGRAYMALVHPSDVEAQAERRRAREDGALDVQRYVIRLLHRDGRSLSFEVHADALQYHGDIASTGGHSRHHRRTLPAPRAGGSRSPLSRAVPEFAGRVVPQHRVGALHRCQPGPGEDAALPRPVGDDPRSRIAGAALR